MPTFPASFARHRLALAAALAFALVACGGSGEDPAPPPAATPPARDAGFGSGGETRLTFGALGGAVGATAVQADGKLLVAGHRVLDLSNDLSPKWQAVIWRLLDNGQPDPAFGQGGEVAIAVRGIDAVEDLLLQPDGKIVAALRVGEPCQAPGTAPIGLCFNQAGQAAFRGTSLLRLNADGTPDAAFGSAGLVTEPGANRTGAFLPRVALQADGRLLRLRSTSDRSVGAFGWELRRLLPDGRPDPEFSAGQDVVSRCAVDGEALAVQPDGRVLVAGTINLSSGEPKADPGFCVERLLADGRPDPAFAVTRQAVGAEVDVLALRVLAGGDLLLAGSARDAGGGRLVALRLDAAGAPRSDYGQAGVAWLPAPDSPTALRFHGAQIDAGGGVLGATSSLASVHQRSWARLTPSGQPDRAWATAGLLSGASLAAGETPRRWLVDAAGRWVTIDTDDQQALVRRWRGG